MQRVSRRGLLRELDVAAAPAATGADVRLYKEQAARAAQSLSEFVKAQPLAAGARLVILVVSCRRGGVFENSARRRRSQLHG